MMNDPLPSTTGTASEEVNTFTHENVNQAFKFQLWNFDSRRWSQQRHREHGHKLAIACKWSQWNCSGTSAYSFDFIDTLDQGYPYHDMGYLACFRFDPTAATAHSSQPGDLFLPLPTHSVDPSTPDSPNLAPQDSIQVLHNPNKWLRISNFTEENILPDNECWKRSKPEQLTL